MKIWFNGEPHECSNATTVAHFLASLQLTPRQVAVEVNLDVVPRDRHASHQLQDGDRVEVVTLVGGG